MHSPEPIQAQELLDAGICRSPMYLKPKNPMRSRSRTIPRLLMNMHLSPDEEGTATAHMYAETEFVSWRSSCGQQSTLRCADAV